MLGRVVAIAAAQPQVVAGRIRHDKLEVPIFVVALPVTTEDGYSGGGEMRFSHPPSLAWTGRMLLLAARAGCL